MKCPVCGKDTYQENEIEYDIPKLGKFKIICGFCNNCKYKFTSMLPMCGGNPKTIKHEINEKTINDIVVRSPYCKVVIPELGLELIPGEKCEGFITTIEGILQRFLDTVEFLEKDEKGKYDEIKKKIQRIIEGKEKATLILEDEKGLSKVVENENFEWGVGHDKCNSS